MPCHHPNKAFATGFKTPNGKDDYVIMFGTTGDILSAEYVVKKRHKFLALNKIPTKKINGKVFLTDPLPIPCGSCVGCRMERAKDWKTRVCLESRYHNQTWFVTLTYDDWHLPRLKDGRPYPKKRDFQLFMKRLRTYTGNKYRYFACSEYGENTGRPHFHMILFGDLVDLYPLAFNVFRSKEIQDSWSYGLTEVSPAEPNCIAYVAGYVEKKQNDPNWDKYPVKPYLLMSRKPGIGFVNISAKTACIDRKVYGNFGSSHYSKIPNFVIRKHENEPWIDQYKLFSRELGERGAIIQSAIYGLDSPELLGTAQDESSYRFLEKKRIAKL